MDQHERSPSPKGRQSWWSRSNSRSGSLSGAHNTTGSAGHDEVFNSISNPTRNPKISELCSTRRFPFFGMEVTVTKRPPSHDSPLESGSNGGSSSNSSSPLATPESELSELADNIDLEPRQRRNSNLGRIVSAAKDRVQEWLKLHRIVIQQRGDIADVEEVTIWTERYTLDLPQEISMDASELEYLRRTNLLEAMAAVGNISYLAHGETLSSSVLEASTEVQMDYDRQDGEIREINRVQMSQFVPAKEGMDESERDRLFGEESMPHPGLATWFYTRKAVSTYSIPLNETDPANPIGTRVLLAQTLEQLMESEMGRTAELSW